MPTNNASKPNNNQSQNHNKKITFSVMGPQEMRQREKIKKQRRQERQRNGINFYHSDYNRLIQQQANTARTQNNSQTNPRRVHASQSPNRAPSSSASTYSSRHNSSTVHTDEPNNTIQFNTYSDPQQTNENHSNQRADSEQHQNQTQSNNRFPTTPTGNTHQVTNHGHTEVHSTNGTNQTQQNQSSDAPHNTQQTDITYNTQQLIMNISNQGSEQVQSSINILPQLPPSILINNLKIHHPDYNNNNLFQAMFSNTACDDKIIFQNIHLILNLVDQQQDEPYANTEVIDALEITNNQNESCWHMAVRRELGAVLVRLLAFYDQNSTTSHLNALVENETDDRNLLFDLVQANLEQRLKNMFIKMISRHNLTQRLLIDNINQHDIGSLRASIMLTGGAFELTTPRQARELFEHLLTNEGQTNTILSELLSGSINIHHELTHANLWFALSHALNDSYNSSDQTLITNYVKWYAQLPNYSPLRQSAYDNLLPEAQNNINDKLANTHSLSHPNGQVFTQHHSHNRHSQLTFFNFNDNEEQELEQTNFNNISLIDMSNMQDTSFTDMQNNSFEFI